MKMENKLKHLEFIQNIITRMNNNSFFIKGWAITLVSALFALAAGDTNLNYVLITYIVLPVFWVLDGFFISKERQFRALYDEVSLITKDDKVDFRMETDKYNKGRNTWPAGIISKTLWPFYGIALCATIIVMFLIK